MRVQNQMMHHIWITRRTVFGIVVVVVAIAIGALSKLWLLELYYHVDLFCVCAPYFGCTNEWNEREWGESDQR